MCTKLLPSLRLATVGFLGFLAGIIFANSLSPKPSPVDPAFSGKDFRPETRRLQPLDEAAARIGPFTTAQRHYGELPHTYRGTFGVSSLMKDFNCGFSNMEVPYFLSNAKGDHKVIIDVGLKDGAETLAAVRSGYVVYAFEPVKQFVHQVTASMEKEGLDFFMVPPTTKRPKRMI